MATTANVSWTVEGNTSGVVIEVEMTREPSDQHGIWDTGLRTATSNGSGVVTIALPKGGTYRVRVQGDEQWSAFSVASDADDDVQGEDFMGDVA